MHSYFWTHYRGLLSTQLKVLLNFLEQELINIDLDHTRYIHPGPGLKGACTSVLSVSPCIPPAVGDNVRSSYLARSSYIARSSYKSIARSRYSQSFLRKYQKREEVYIWLTIHFIIAKITNNFPLTVKFWKLQVS